MSRLKICLRTLTALMMALVLIACAVPAAVSAASGSDQTEVLETVSSYPYTTKTKVKVNLRAKRSTRSTLLKKIPAEAEITVNAVKGSWAEVEYKKYSGYVKTDYIVLKEVKKVKATPTPTPVVTLSPEEDAGGYQILQKGATGGDVIALQEALIELGFLTGKADGDFGAGTTDVAVISLGGLVVSQSVQVGGNKFDEALVEYLRKECSILVGSQTAENIKKDLATALPLEEDRTILVRGINQLNTSAGTVSFSSAQAYAALQGPCSAIVRAIRWVMERTPPELAADIMRGGIHLTGDAARLFALDRYISESVGIPVLLAKDPGDCCILGIGYLTENIQLVTPKGRQQDKPVYK